MTQTEVAAVASIRRPGALVRVRVGVIGGTGYAGGELLRLLARHPHVEVVGVTARGRDDEPIELSHPHLAATGHRVRESLPDGVEAVFVALPHGAAAGMVPDFLGRDIAVIDLGPDFRLRNPADYPRWYGFEHPRPDLLAGAVFGLPELHRTELVQLRESDTRIVGAPGCYSTATILALAPLARENLIDDVVVDAKSGVSGAGREVKAEMQFSEVNESVKAYGVTGHRHVAEMEQELRALGATRLQPVDFLPHLIPMTRGILAACHVRPTRAVDQDTLDSLYADFYRGELFVEVVASPPQTKHVTGSNTCRIFVRSDERTGRILVLSVVDNLVKGAAGQAVQAFNVFFDLPEESGLEQLPLSP